MPCAPGHIESPIEEFGAAVRGRARESGDIYRNRRFAVGTRERSEARRREAVTGGRDWKRSTGFVDTQLERQRPPVETLIADHRLSPSEAFARMRRGACNRRIGTVAGGERSDAHALRLEIYQPLCIRRRKGWPSTYHRPCREG